MREAISDLVSAAIREAIDAGELKLAEPPDPALERPRDPSHGDWATTVALRSAKLAGMQPRQIAEIVAARIADHPDIAAVEIAGPGFVNLRLSAPALQRVLREAREADRDFGRLDLGDGRRVQVEFVSANPVGPMHVGHGRWAALGDSMARVLAHAGWDVEREFYINDAGVQMDIFAKSVSARYLELCGRHVAFPADGYQGAYIADIAQEMGLDRVRFLADFAGRAEEEFKRDLLECRQREVHGFPTFLVVVDGKERLARGWRTFEQMAGLIDLLAGEPVERRKSSFEELNVLDFVERHGSAAVREVSEVFDVSDASAKAVLDRLVGAGALELARSGLLYRTLSVVSCDARTGKCL